MASDPYTLLIALDSSQEATGTVYIDDGSSYEYEKGAVIYQSLSYKSDELKCTPSNSGKLGMAQLPETISTKVEAIVITGFDQIRGLPSAATLGHLVLSVENDGDSIIRIRMPPVSLSDNWSITFKF